MSDIWPGTPFPLGAVWDGHGTNFSLFSENAHRVELLLSFPFLALLFAWYLWLGMRPESAAQHPEKLYQERAFFAFCLFQISL